MLRTRIAMSIGREITERILLDAAFAGGPSQEERDRLQHLGRLDQVQQKIQRRLHYERVRKEAAARKEMRAKVWREKQEAKMLEEEREESADPTDRAT